MTKKMYNIYYVIEHKQQFSIFLLEKRREKRPKIYRRKELTGQKTLACEKGGLGEFECAA